MYVYMCYMCVYVLMMGTEHFFCVCCVRRVGVVETMTLKGVRPASVSVYIYIYKKVYIYIYIYIYVYMCV